MNLRIWLRAIRLWTTIGIIIPITSATVFAWYHNGVFDGFLFGLVFIAGLFLFFGQSLFNDYYDHRFKADDLYNSPYPFSGGSRVIQEGLISPRNIFFGGFVCFIIVIGIGLYLNFLLDRVTLLVIGTFGIFLNFFYTAPPFRFAYRGLGEFVGGLGAGPIIMAGAYYVQTQTVSIDILLVSIPFGLFTSAFLMFYKIPAYESDKKADKRNLIVRLGRTNVITVFSTIMILVYLSIIILVLTDYLPIWALLSLITLSLIIKPIKNARQNYAYPEKFASSAGTTVIIHILFTILFILGLIIDKIVYIC